MAFTSQQIKDAAKEWVKIFHADRTITANLNTDDIEAAIQSIDSAMDTVINSLPGAWGTKTIKQVLIDSLPEPFQSTSGAAQKALVLSVWAMKEAGVI